MSSDEESAWVMYRDRPEWRDVTPLPQDDTADPVVAIAYTENFVDVFDYFRAVYASGEVSERALRLTQDALELNPANYTVWHHRRTLLKALNKEPGDELAYIRHIMEDNPKNYQVWQHRRAMVEWLNDPSMELRFTAIILAQDTKNYHAWQHRQWVVSTFVVFDEELGFVDNMLEEDIRNNSAWNHRFFVVSHTAPEGKIGGQLLDREIEYAFKAIKKAWHNESPWNYLRGLLDRCEEEEKARARLKVKSFCEGLDKEHDEKKSKKSPFLLSTMLDIETDELEQGTLDDKQAASTMKRAQELCQMLADDVDVVRKHYWQFVASDLQNKYQTMDVA